MRSFFSSQKRVKGYTLVEMLIYVGILATLMVVVVKTLLVVTQAYTSLSVSRSLNNAALTSFERMTRDIRQATSVDGANSSLDVSNGVLALSNATTSEKFYLSNGIVKSDRNGSYEGPLTGIDTNVSKLMFSSLAASSTSKAVRIDMVISSGTGKYQKSAEFYVTVGLRGSY